MVSAHSNRNPNLETVPCMPARRVPFESPCKVGNLECPWRGEFGVSLVLKEGREGGRPGDLGKQLLGDQRGGSF